MIKGIFFDLGWTLFHPKCSEWYINDKFLEYADADVLGSIPDEKRREVFDKALRFLDDNHRLYTEKEEIRQFQEFYKIIAHGLPELGITNSQSDEIGEYKVLDTSNYVFYDKTADTLMKLKKHYRLGIISDTWPSADRILRSGGIADLFDCKTYSCCIGVCKPDRRMYIDAVEKIGLPAEQTAFVDDYEKNLEGAADCGIIPILTVARQGASIPGERYSKPCENSWRYPVIEDIGELPELIEKL